MYGGRDVCTVSIVAVGSNLSSLQTCQTPPMLVKLLWIATPIIVITEMFYPLKISKSIP